MHCLILGVAAIIGLPNAGKSTLMNQLSGKKVGTEEIIITKRYVILIISIDIDCIPESADDQRTGAWCHHGKQFTSGLPVVNSFLYNFYNHHISDHAFIIHWH